MAEETQEASTPQEPSEAQIQSDIFGGGGEPEAKPEKKKKFIPGNFHGTKRVSVLGRHLFNEILFG